MWDKLSLSHSHVLFSVVCGARTKSPVAGIVPAKRQKTLLLSSFKCILMINNESSERRLMTDKNIDGVGVIQDEPIEVTEFDKTHIEHAKSEHADNRHFWNTANSAAVEFSNATMKALLILNGGASISMLGFTATVSASGSNALDISRIISVLQCFSVGAALAVLAAGFAYLVMFFQAATSSAYTEHFEHPYIRGTQISDRNARIANFFHVCAVIVAIGSLVFFVIGVCLTGSIVLDAAI